MTAPSPMSQGPFTPPPAEPVSKSAARRNLVIAGVLGGGGCLLVLLLVIGLIIFFAVRGGGEGSGGGPAGDGGDPTVAELTPEEQATALVTDYFDALVAGDGAAALELMPPMEGTDAVALPAEAYTTALELAPVADVVVSPPAMDPNGISGEVAVSFTVGGESVSDVYNVDDYDSDEVFALDSATLSVDVPDGASGLGMTVNSAEVTDGQRLHLLPGGYTVAYSNAHFAPASTDPVLAGKQYEVDALPEPALSEDGLTAFRGAVQKAVDACLTQNTLKAGCGMGEVPATSSDGWTMVEGTVKRSISEDTQRTIDTMEGTPAYDELTYVEGTAIGSVETTIECTKDGQKGTCEMWLGGGMGIPHVDMADPELPVTWS